MWYKEIRFDVESVVDHEDDIYEFSSRYVYGRYHAVTVIVTLSITNGAQHPIKDILTYKADHPDVVEAWRLAFQDVLNKNIYNYQSEIQSSPVPPSDITEMQLNIRHLPQGIQEMILEMFGTGTGVYNDILPPKLLNAQNFVDL